jgi:hypothetical protein
MRYFQEDRKCHKIELVTFSSFPTKAAQVNAKSQWPSDYIITKASKFMRNFRNVEQPASK